MVELVEERPGLEGVGLDDDRRALGREAPHHDLGGPGHIAGQVGHRQAALPGQLEVAGQDEDGIEEDEGAVAGVGLLVSGHVDAERPDRHPDLGRGHPDAVGRREHGVEQVGGQRLLVGADLGHRVAHPLEHVVGDADDGPDGHEFLASVL